MTTVIAVGPLRPAGGPSRISVDATTVRDALTALGPDTYEKLFENATPDAPIRSFVAVFVNGEPATAETRVRATDEVTVLPAVAGGCEDGLEKGAEIARPVLEGFAARHRGGAAY
ncbi:MAG: MoaD/ThiS family protein [Thermoplasmatota archaeon]